MPDPRPKPPVRLGGLTLGVPDPAATGAFFADALGLHLETPPDAVSVLCEGDYGPTKAQRALTLVAAETLELREARFEVARPDDCAELAEAAGRAGARRTDPPSTEGIAFEAPGGLRIVCAPAAPAPANVPASVLAPRRLGHFNLKVPDPADVARFLVRGMGMALSEQIGDGLFFLRLATEHHNIGLRAARETAVHHIGLEMAGWEVYRPVLDRLADHGHRIEFGPGRHGPGRNIFVYVREPSSGLRVELFADMAHVSEQDDPDVPLVRWRAEDRMSRTLNRWGGPPPPQSFLD